MIAKLVTHAPSRAAAIEAQAARARRVLHRRHPAQHPVPVGADAASALARGQSVDRLHRRGISRRVFGRAPPEGEVARRIAAVAAAIDHVLGERKRQISGQMIGRAVTRERPPRGLARSRARSCSTSRARTTASPCRFVGADGSVGQCRIALVSHWTPGEPVWQGTHRRRIASRCRCGRSPNGFRLAHQGFEVAVYVYTESRSAPRRG